MKDNRPSWDEIWMNFAHEIAKKSPDPKHKIGSVIVTEDNTSMWCGFNSDEVNGDNKRFSMKSGCSTFIHSETNAMLHLDFSDQRPKKMYLTHSPCIVCSRMIVNARTIKKVIYYQEYDTDLRGFEILKKHDIIVEKYRK